MRRRSLAGQTAFAAAALILMTPQLLTDAGAADWWMLQQTETGRECSPPIEADGIKLTPDVLMKQHSECKLMDETPSLDLETVMVNCEGDIGRVFIFSKSKASCERLAQE